MTVRKQPEDAPVAWKGGIYRVWMAATCVFLWGGTIGFAASASEQPVDRAGGEEGESVEEVADSPRESGSSEGESVRHQGRESADDPVREVEIPPVGGSRTVGGARARTPFDQWIVIDPTIIKEFIELPEIPMAQETAAHSAPPFPEAWDRGRGDAPEEAADPPGGPQIRIRPLPGNGGNGEPARVARIALPDSQPAVQPARREPYRHGGALPSPSAVRLTPASAVSRPGHPHEPAVAPRATPVPLGFIASQTPEILPGTAATRQTRRARQAPTTNPVDALSEPANSLFIGPGESLFLWAEHPSSPVRFDAAVNLGSWTMGGGRANVLVRDYVLNDGWMRVLKGATFTKPGGAIVNNGTLLVDGAATFTDRDIITATRSDAFMTVGDASTATATDDFVAGSGKSRTGRVEVSGGSTLNAGNLVLGESGRGLLYASDAVLQVSEDLLLGEKRGSSGELHLVNVTLDVGKKVKLGQHGDGLLTAVASALHVEDSVEIAAKNKASGSLLLSHSTAEIGGDLKVASKNGSTGQIDIAGGSLVVRGTVEAGGHKQAMASIAVREGGMLDVEEKLEVDSASEVRVADASLLVGEKAEVKGTLSLDGATASVTDDLTLNGGSLLTAGSLLSIGDDLVLKKGSTVSGSSGDVYEVGGDFKSEIELATEFDLSEVTVKFVGAPGTDHQLTVAGLDVGADPSGYVGNYAFGGLHLAAGQYLEVKDTSGGAPALYVGEVVLDDGISQLANIGGDAVVIYYDANLPENAYLNGETYALGDGILTPGLLIPEPGTGTLLVLALVLSHALRAGSRRRV